MKEQLLLLLRVSKPEYNRTLYEDYKLYMNNQFSYKKTGLTKGQFDTKEGMVAGEGVRLLYSVDDRKTWTELHGQNYMEFKQCIKIIMRTYTVCMALSMIQHSMMQEQILIIILFRGSISKIFGKMIR